EQVEAEEEEQPLADAALVDLPEAGDEVAEQGGQRVELDRRQRRGLVGGRLARLRGSHRRGSTRKRTRPGTSGNSPTAGRDWQFGDYMVSGTRRGGDKETRRGGEKTGCCLLS